MLADRNTTEAVKTVLDQFAKRYSAKNVQGIMELFTTDDDLACIGTLKEDRRIGREQVTIQLNNDFTWGAELRAKFENVMVSAAGSVAWVLADYVVDALESDGKTIHMVARFTGVLEQQNDKWLIMQAHWSVPDASKTGACPSL